MGSGVHSIIGGKNVGLGHQLPLSSAPRHSAIPFEHTQQLKQGNACRGDPACEWNMISYVPSSPPPAPPLSLRS